MHAMLTWVNYVEGFKRIGAGLPVWRPLLPPWMVAPAAWVVILTFFWNGMFFLQRVIDSHTRHAVRLQGQKAPPHANGNGNGKHAVADEDKDD